MSMVQIAVKWSGKEFNMELQPHETVEALKRRLEEETSVQPKRQKLLGLKTRDGGKPAVDDTPVGELALKPGARVMMMGSAEAAIQSVAKAAEEAPSVADDFDIGEDALATFVHIKDRPEVVEKLARRIASVEPKVLHPPRPGKKCLVLDIDYTLFDLGSAAERPQDLARPYLHEFLATAYEHYDIIIWSATSMRYVEVKMKELGVSTHPAYRLTAFLDHKSMLTVHHEQYGLFDCKPLAYIWAKFGGAYHEGNTIMMDDLRRNYVMNMQNGLVIRPYRKSHRTRHTDHELLYLSHYLAAIAGRESLADLDHARWERAIRVDIRRLRAERAAAAGAGGGAEEGAEHDGGEQQQQQQQQQGGGAGS